MDRSTLKAISGASLFLAIGLTSALVVSGEWLIAVGALGGWAVGLWIIRSVAAQDGKQPYDTSARVRSRLGYMANRRNLASQPVVRWVTITCGIMGE